MGQVRPADIFSAMVVHFKQGFDKMCGRKLAIMQPGSQSHAKFGVSESVEASSDFDMGNVGFISVTHYEREQVLKLM